MKNQLILLFVMLSFATSAQSFIEQDKQWNVLVWDLNIIDGNTEAVWRTDSYKFEGDTTINSVSYSVLKVASDSLQLNWTPNNYCREEADKVYMWDASLNKEIILYDFNLNEGDSIVVQEPYHYVDSLALAVDSVRLVSYFGDERKTIYLSVYGFMNGNSWLCYEEAWIDAIGSEYGLCRNIAYCINGLNHDEQTICVSSSGNLLFQNPIYPDCYSASSNSVPRVEQSNITLKVLPNPISSNSQIEILADYHNGGKVEVFNITGQVLTSQVVSQSQSFVKINQSVLPSGLFVLSFTTNDGQQVFCRFVKQ